MLVRSISFIALLISGIIVTRVENHDYGLKIASFYPHDNKSVTVPDTPSAVIRINLLGYRPNSPKIAVWGSLKEQTVTSFQLVDEQTNQDVQQLPAGQAFGTYGPFRQTYRLDFSTFRKPGRYYLRTSDGTRSPGFQIGEDVYKGAADFCLRYMRQQRSGFNPFLKDSCHTHDGYTLYGPMPDSTHIDVVGGWHDASDYLQYVITSANATYHLLAALRDFPNAFGDTYQTNGLEGKNGQPDILDEARWGLDWLLKMHPKDDWLFNQLGDDRDHAGMRIPKLDSMYGKEYERPVYFATGQPQGMFKYKNRTTGVASTAGKVSSALALGYQLLRTRQSGSVDHNYVGQLRQRAQSAYKLGLEKPGNCQTAPGRAPYFYEEDNYADDMELATIEQLNVDGATGKQALIQQKTALDFARKEPVTPWIINDTARHYQWYPFVNIGHVELAKKLTGVNRKTVTDFYKSGIETVWQRAQQNAFYRGVPFIWCSNNLTTSFATQCFWYRQLTKDNQYAALEQANFDWLFGCNPWGTSFVYGLPAQADTPSDPHSAFTHLKNYPIDGGLVDGPVRGSIYSKLIGITLYEPDEYAAYQSNVAVYHDDYGDYSTNEPTMDGTASLVYLLAAKQAERLAPSRSIPKKVNRPAKKLTQPKGNDPKSTYFKGAKIRGDTTARRLALVFTGDEFADGGPTIARTLLKHGVRASFFLTGRFLRNPAFASIIQQLIREGHYVGPHSDQHLLYCDWTKRDSLLVSHEQFTTDLTENCVALARFGRQRSNARLFLPPYEWYNDSIAAWTKAEGIQLINYTPGTLSHTDYTTPQDRNYRSSSTILESIRTYEQKKQNGLNGFMLLMHIGTAPSRTDKLYNHLDELLTEFRQKSYQLVSVDEL